MFGRVLRDLYEPTDYIVPGGVFHTPYFIMRQRPQATVAPRRSDAKRDSNKFQVMVNVKHFRPHEIDVKTVDNFVVIHGQHEEQADEYGFVTREFTRRCRLPDDVEPCTVTSSLSQDGVLTIQAPRKMLEAAVVVAQKQQQQLQKQLQQLQKQQQQLLEQQEQILEQQEQILEQQEQILEQQQQQQVAQQASKEPKQ